MECITLKDICELDSFLKEVGAEIVLKKEAIKIINKMEIGDLGDYGIWLNEDTYTNDMRDLFKHFFNIKEEELN